MILERYSDSEFWLLMKYSSRKQGVYEKKWQSMKNFKLLLFKHSSMFWIFVLYSCLGTFLLEKPLVESTPASVTNITTPVDSISPLMTTDSTTPMTTDPSPCQDVNKMNMFILPCIGPLFFTISSVKNATTFCGYVHMT